MKWPNSTYLSLFYEKRDFMARASFVWRGGYLDDVRAGEDEITNITDPDRIGLPANSLDVFVDDFFRFDLRIEYRLRYGFTLFFEGTNLTNEPLKKYNGIEFRLNSIQFTKPIYFLGIKWNM